MAIERGKPGDLLDDNAGSRLGQIAATALGVIERMPPWKASMANRTIRSPSEGKLVDPIRARSLV